MKNYNTANNIVRRIVRDAGAPELLEVLAERIAMTDLQSLLLEVYKRRTARISPAAVLRQYAENRFVHLAHASPQEFVEFDRLAYSLLPPDFEALELSPVSPLGSCSALATVDQNNAVTTVRNTEVCADSTNVLALECAIRRTKSAKRSEIADTKLCASHRLLRGQRFDGPVSFPHFRVFSLCTAGHDRGKSEFEKNALCEQIDFYLRLFTELKKECFPVGPVRVTVTPFAGGDASILELKVIPMLAALHREATFGLDLERKSGSGYYIWSGFRILATSSDRSEHFLVDGGFTNWAEKLMNDRKERLLISGMGTERFLTCFKRQSKYPILS